MSDSTSQSLAAAYQQIEAGNLVEARNIVEPIIGRDEDNADAWWVYAHAVENEDEAREALGNVLRIDPNYPGAAELLNQTSSDEAAFDDDLFEDLDQMDVTDDFEIDEGDFEDDFDMQAPATTGSAQQEGGGRNRLPLLLIPVVVLLIAVVAFFLLQGGDDDESDTTEPTEIAQVSNAEPTEPTEEAVEQVETEATTEIEPVTDTSQAISEITSTLEENFTLADDQPTTVRDSELGSIEVIAVCLEGDRRESLSSVMSALTEIDLTTVQRDAIGVQLVDCDADEIINLIGVRVSDVQQFSADEISEQEFQSRWQAIG